MSKSKDVVMASKWRHLPFWVKAWLQTVYKIMPHFCWVLRGFHLNLFLKAISYKAAYYIYKSFNMCSWCTHFFMRTSSIMSRKSRNETNLGGERSLSRHRLLEGIVLNYHSTLSVHLNDSNLLEWMNPFWW